MKEKFEVFKEFIFKFIKEKRIYCIIGAIAVFIILAVSSIFIIVNKNVDNFSGNLFNKGFAVSLGKWTYYIKDDGIYKVNSNGSNIQQVLSSKASYLNVEKKNLYFIEYNENDAIYNLVRVNKKGEDKQTIINNVDNKMITLLDGWIYYLQDDIFYKIRTNGKDKIKLLDENIETYQIKGNEIFYTYKSGISYLMAKMKANGKNILELEMDCNSNFYVNDNTIYYIKEKYSTEKYQYEYTLCKMKTNGEDKKELVKLPDTAKQINMNEDGIYYLTTDDFVLYKLWKMDYKSENPVEITNTYFNTKINVIRNHIYYTDAVSDEETVMYRIKGTDKQMI